MSSRAQLVSHRVCNTCKIRKPRDHFGFGPYRGDLRGDCKPCVKVYNLKNNTKKRLAKRAAIALVAQPCTKCAESGTHRLGRPTSPGVFTCTHHLIAAIKKGEKIGYIDGIK